MLSHPHMWQKLSCSQLDGLTVELQLINQQSCEVALMRTRRCFVLIVMAIMGASCAAGPFKSADVQLLRIAPCYILCLISQVQQWTCCVNRNHGLYQCPISDGHCKQKPSSMSHIGCTDCCENIRHARWYHQRPFVFS